MLEANEGAVAKFQCVFFTYISAFTLWTFKEQLMLYNTRKQKKEINFLGL